jgi:DNA ligase N terminus
MSGSPVALASKVGDNDNDPGTVGLSTTKNENSEPDDTPMREEDGIIATDNDGDNNDEENDSHGDNNDDDTSTDSGKADLDVTGLERPPSYTRANSIDFRMLCQRLEALDKISKTNNNKSMSKEEKLSLLLPPKLLKAIADGEPPGSPFPIIRLLLPGKDSSRSFTTKEKSIAIAYSDAFSFKKGHLKREALYCYTDPIKLAAAHVGWDKFAGDLSLLVEAVVKDRTVPSKKSRATVGRINALLDELVSGLSTKKGRSGQSEDQWRGSSHSQSQALASVPPKKPKQADIRARFVTALIDLKVTPLEHKWIVRILLGSIKVGVGFEPILNWFSPHANDLWKTHNR